MSGKLFFGGMPTDLEVRALHKAFPNNTLTVGRVISYDDVAAVIGVKRNTSRWSCITGRWRRAVERETGGTILGTKKGVGYEVLSDTGKLELAESKVATSVRASRRAYRITGYVDQGKLTGDEKARLLVAQQRTAAVIAASQIKGSADNIPSLGRT